MHEWDENVKDHDGDRIISKFYEYMDDSVTLKFFTNRNSIQFRLIKFGHGYIALCTIVN